MSHLYIKQKVFALSERFAITDADQQPRYLVSGTFMAIPKRFTITDAHDTVVAEITKTVFSLLPTFTVSVAGRPIATIRKEFTFFKPRYRIDSTGITVSGDWWDLNFAVLLDDREIARIRKKWLSWGDTYEVAIEDDSLEVLVVALVVAIDRVMQDSSSAASAAG